MASSPVAVSQKVDETLRKHLVSKARDRCMSLIEDFGKCTDGKFFSVAWSCRTQFNEMNECMHRYTNDEEFDRLKRHWIQKEETKRRAKENTTTGEL